MKRDGITNTSISVEKHKKVKLLLPLTDMNLTKFYDNAVDCYIEKLSNENSQIKMYLDIQKGK